MNLILFTIILKQKLRKQQSNYIFQSTFMYNHFQQNNL